MTVNVSKPAFNIREKLSELDRPVGNHGTQLMQSADVAESFNLVRAGRKNLIINGSCMVDQRNSGSAVSSGYGVDRTHVEGFYGAGTGTAQQVSDAPAGLFKSLKITVTGPDTSLSSTDFYTLRHIIEGQNVAHLGFGTNNAKTVTLSFWVKSSITGIFCCSLGNGTNNKTMPKEYHIYNSNRWEYKTLTFAPATTGTWGTNNGRGFSVRWCMGVGSQRRGDADTYNGNESHGTSNQKNLFGVNGATFQITGMQLEEGNAATPFEQLSYGEELALCQRYYYQINDNKFRRCVAGYKRHDSNVHFEINCPVPMRAAPAPTLSDGGLFTNFQTTFTASQSSPVISEWNTDTGQGLLVINSTYSSTHVVIPSWEGYQLQLSAEL